MLLKGLEPLYRKVIQLKSIVSTNSTKIAILILLLIIVYILYIYIYISSMILIRILAQLVERSFYTRKVIGSNPIFPKCIYSNLYNIYIYINRYIIIIINIIYIIYI